MDEAAAALTRMRAEPAAVAADQDTGRSLVAAACSEGDIGNFTIFFSLIWPVGMKASNNGYDGTNPTFSFTLIHTHHLYTFCFANIITYISTF